MDKIEVNVDVYCLVPISKTRCPFYYRSLFVRKCRLFNVKVKTAVHPYTDVVLPCKECEDSKKRKMEKNK